MGKSKILDRGEETIELYPEVWTTNRRGEKFRKPADTPIIVRCTVAEDRQAMAELPGQVTVKILRILTRYVEGIGPETRAVFRGEEWDMASPPHYSSGVSRGMRHMELMIRSRNGLGYGVSPGGFGG